MKQQGFLPAATARLFDGYAAAELLRDVHQDFLLERLLEEGDREDLRWLCARVGETAIRVFVREQGERRLSARSRAFWRLVLAEPREPESPETESPEPGPPSTSTGSELWPLA